MSNIIYIYSKYSRYCIELDDIVKKIGNINTLCVDNPIAKKRILLNEELNITQVPTVIVHNENTKIYEGDSAKHLLTDIYNNIYNTKTEDTIKQEVIQDEEERSSIQDVVNQEEEVEVNDEDEDLMSKVERLQKSREQMIPSEES